MVLSSKHLNWEAYQSLPNLHTYIPTLERSKVKLFPRNFPINTIKYNHNIDESTRLNHNNKFLETNKTSNHRIDNSYVKLISSNYNKPFYCANIDVEQPKIIKFSKLSLLNSDLKNEGTQYSKSKNKNKNKNKNKTALRYYLDVDIDYKSLYERYFLEKQKDKNTNKNKNRKTFPLFVQKKAFLEQRNDLRSKFKGCNILHPGFMNKLKNKNAQERSSFLNWQKLIPHQFSLYSNHSNSKLGKSIMNNKNNNKDKGKIFFKCKEITHSCSSKKIQFSDLPDSFR